jgi:hypothetical protein
MLTAGPCLFSTYPIPSCLWWLDLQPEIGLEEHLANLVSEHGRGRLDPCLRACFTYALGADDDHLQAVVGHYKSMRNSTVPLPPAPAPPLCPGTIGKDGALVVSPPRAPRSLTSKTITLSSDTHTFGLPQGWDDDQVYNWKIGRPIQDFVVLVRDRGDRELKNESRTVIHPKRNLHLRFPSLAAGTFQQKTPNPDDFAVPYMRVRVEACQCLTAPGCDAFQAPRNGVSQCTYLGYVETTPEGGFRALCEPQAAVDGDSPPTSCGFSAGGQDVVFTVFCFWSHARASHYASHYGVVGCLQHACG